MINHYLNSAIEDIKNLIVITLNDIEDIKNGRHDIQFERNETKEEILISFENKKKMIDNEIVKMSSDNPNEDIEVILGEETVSFLDELKNKLEELKEENKKYARLVLSVGEFYNAMLDEVIPNNTVGYGNNANNPTGVYKVRA